MGQCRVRSLLARALVLCGCRLGCAEPWPGRWYFVAVVQGTLPSGQGKSITWLWYAPTHMAPPGRLGSFRSLQYGGGQYN